MTTVLVHGSPETSQIWAPLRQALDRETEAVALPGFGTVRPDGFSGTKDAYSEWLAEVVRACRGPVDLVGHDFGALLAMRLASAVDVPLRSWVVDVADIFHPDFVWPERMQNLQRAGVGEKILTREREAAAGDAQGTVAHLISSGVPTDLAIEIASAHDATMSRSILDFYRSAVPNVAADWWAAVSGHSRSRGLVLLLPDPPASEAKSLEVASRLGAQTTRLEGLGHCWMAEAPETVARVLERFWSSLN